MSPMPTPPTTIVRSPLLDGKADVTILLPAHNEAACLEPVLRSFYDEISKRLKAEIVVVEDGSTDGTKDILRRLAKELPLLADMADHRRGYSPAIVTGARHASGKYVLFVDSDGQHFPEDFWRLWDARASGPVISGARTPRADSAFRKLMSRVFTTLAHAWFKLPRLRDLTAPMRLVEAGVAAEIASEFRYMRESFWTEFTIRCHAKGYRTTEVDVRHRPALRPEATRVYTVGQLPRIVSRQFQNLNALRAELRTADTA